MTNIDHDLKIDNSELEAAIPRIRNEINENSRDSGEIEKMSEIYENQNAKEMNSSPRSSTNASRWGMLVDPMGCILLFLRRKG